MIGDMSHNASSDDGESAAERLLSLRGFRCEAEPDWVTGKRPDFFCSGPAEFWVEVKTLDEPIETKRPGEILTWLNAEASRVQNNGFADATVSDDANKRDVVAALRLADRALAQSTLKRPPRRTFVVIPSDPDYARFVRIEVEAEDGLEIFHCCESISGKYGRPIIAPELRYDTPAILTTQTGEKIVRPVDEIGFFDDQMRLGLELERNDESFHIASVMRQGGMWLSRSKSRIRDAISEANAQLRSGRKFRRIPSLVLIYQRGLFMPRNRVFFSALLGDDAVRYSISSSAKAIKLEDQYFAENGVWNSRKNTSTSAACIVRNDEEPLPVHNYWAQDSLPKGLMGGIEYVPRDDGTFELLR